MASATNRSPTKWKTEPYVQQKKCFWPREGRHILAQFDEHSVVVYQAFKPSIAEYAVHNQRFGGPDFSFERMSWIKTNFLWMMYRCGWATKQNQERVLAVRITKDGFENILANAYTAQFQKSKGVNTGDIEVRLQWDPDHSPTYEKLDRRAIQLGLKNTILSKYCSEWIVDIQDVTKFVKDQFTLLRKSGPDAILTASERVYTPSHPGTAERIQLDFYENSPENVKVITHGNINKKTHTSGKAQNSSEHEALQSETQNT